MSTWVGIEAWEDEPSRRRVSAPYVLDGALVCDVTLTKGAKTLIDAGDAELVGRRCWQLNTGGYASCHFRPRKGSTPLHRFLTAAPSGTEVDHINRNRLDNRRCNLRLVPPAGNRQNMPCRQMSCTGERGVSVLRETRCGRTRVRYAAKVTLNGKTVFRRAYYSIDEAIASVRAARARYLPFSSEALEAANA